MKSLTLPSFWQAYLRLEESVRRKARKTDVLWSQNPFHPSLHFKCINRDEDLWSVRITRWLSALGIREGECVTWFWIGNHDDYENFY